MTTAPQKLTGADLLSFVQANPDLTKSELAREAGYTRVGETRKGEVKEFILVQDFVDELLIAQGLQFKAAPRGTGARSAAYEVSVQGTGMLLLGKNYVTEAGLLPTDKLKIEVNAEGNEITLSLLKRGPGVDPNKPKRKRRTPEQIAADKAAAEAATAPAEPAFVDPSDL